MSATTATPNQNRSAERLQHDIVVGKDILELVSSSMYIDPLTVFREYVQNAVDSIDEAVEKGVLKSSAVARIDISLNCANRRINIIDTGVGLRREKLARTMTAFGASKKRGTSARGFRGVGRLSGLGYCKRLIFRSRHFEEQRVSEIHWDCERLKMLLRDHSYHGSLDDIVREIVFVRWSEQGEYPPHFFEVEMQEPVRIKNDLLLNEEAVNQYLSQVGPVPFPPEFSLGKKIGDFLRERGVGTAYNIYINNSTAPIYRPYRDTFDARLGVIDAFKDFEPVEIEGVGDGIAAVGWILNHGYKGALPGGLGVKGMRLRKGNIQVGRDDLLDEVFDEPRFNSWCVAELHVVGKNLVPNGRRDSFDLNRDYQDLLGKLKPYAKRLSKLCREKSQERHATPQQKAGTITPRQEAIIGRFSKSKQGAIREVINALYHVKGAEAETTVTAVLSQLVRSLTNQ